VAIPSSIVLAPTFYMASRAVLLDASKLSAAVASEGRQGEEEEEEDVEEDSAAAVAAGLLSSRSGGDGGGDFFLFTPPPLEQRAAGARRHHRGGLQHYEWPVAAAFGTSVDGGGGSTAAERVQRERRTLSSSPWHRPSRGSSRLTLQHPSPAFSVLRLSADAAAAAGDRSADVWSLAGPPFHSLRVFQTAASVTMTTPVAQTRADVVPEAQAQSAARDTAAATSALPEFGTVETALSASVAAVNVGLPAPADPLHNSIVDDERGWAASLAGGAPAEISSVTLPVDLPDDAAARLDAAALAGENAALRLRLARLAALYDAERERADGAAARAAMAEARARVAEARMASALTSVAARLQVAGPETGVELAPAAGERSTVRPNAPDGLSAVDERTGGNGAPPSVAHENAANLSDARAPAVTNEHHAATSSVGTAGVAIRCDGCESLREELLLARGELAAYRRVDVYGRSLDAQLAAIRRGAAERQGAAEASS
jgi:hypothetical protein